MKYNVIIYFDGEAEIEIEATSPEEAESKARMQFNTFDIDGANISGVEVVYEDEV